MHLCRLSPVSAERDIAEREQRETRERDTAERECAKREKTEPRHVYPSPLALKVPQPGQFNVSIHPMDRRYPDSPPPETKKTENTLRVLFLLGQLRTLKTCALICVRFLSMGGSICGRRARRRVCTGGCGKAQVCSIHHLAVRWAHKSNTSPLTASFQTFFVHAIFTEVGFAQGASEMREFSARSPYFHTHVR